jgi:hypothetical protein
MRTLSVLQGLLMQTLLDTEGKIGSPFLDSPLLAPYAHLGMWRARCIVGTGKANRTLVRAALERLYYHHGRNNDPWIVWCEGPFQLCVMRHLFPHVITTPLWAQLSQRFRVNVYPGDNWEPQWQQLLNEVIKPLIHEGLLAGKYRLCNEIAPGFPAEDMIERLIAQLHSELERRLRSEARQSDDLNSRVMHDMRMPETDTSKWRSSVAKRFPNMRFKLNELQNRCAALYERPSWSKEEEFDTLEPNMTDAGTLARLLSNTVSQDWPQLVRHGWYDLTNSAWNMPILPRYTLYRPFIKDVLGKETDEELVAWTLLAEHCDHIIFTDAIAYVGRKPIALRYDASRRFDNDGGPAVEWADGFAIYAMRNVAIKPRFIIERDSLTAEDVDEERNTEVRRRLLDLFGLERYLSQTNAEMVHTDECGELWRRIQVNDEALLMLKVRNSTPEPNGSIKDYVLRVPPTMTTARAAVAWTFGMTEEEYKPEKET